MYAVFDYKFLASDITRVRKQRKLTQTQLAAACGMNQTTISRLENPDNKHSVTLATLNKVAAALGANMRVVFKPAEADTLTQLPTKKPQPTPFEAKQLSDWEYERLEEIGRRFDAAHAAKQEEPNPWAGRYTKTVEYGEDGKSYVEEFHFDQTDEELMEAFQRGELT